jgi:hypothetical protein
VGGQQDSGDLQLRRMCKAILIILELSFESKHELSFILEIGAWTK